MTVSATSVAVTAAAKVLIARGDDEEHDRSLLLKNVTGTAPVYLGGADLALGAPPTNAYVWAVADGAQRVPLGVNDELYAVLATGAAAQTLAVLASSG